MLMHRAIKPLADHFAGLASTNVLADHGVAQFYHGGKSGKGATVAKSEATVALLQEVIVEHGCIDALICNDAHLAIRALID